MVGGKSSVDVTLLAQDKYELEQKSCTERFWKQILRRNANNFRIMVRISLF